MNTATMTMPNALPAVPAEDTTRFAKGIAVGLLAASIGALYTVFLSTAEKNELAYSVLSDSSLAAANGFGIAFQMPLSLIDLYSKAGNDLPVLNGNGQWVLPLPATYVIGRDGRIAFAHIDADYRARAEPADVLVAVIQAKAAGDERNARA